MQDVFNYSGAILMLPAITPDGIRWSLLFTCISVMKVKAKEDVHFK